MHVYVHALGRQLTGHLVIPKGEAMPMAEVCYEHVYLSACEP